MYCNNCGNQINENSSFCNQCGTPVQSVQNLGQQPNVVNQNNQTNYVQSPNQNKSKKSHVGLIIIGVIGGFVLLFVLIFHFVSANSNKLICESKEGNITIMYNDKGLTGYKAVNIKYDFDGQKEIAERIGVQSYISQFKTWFSNNTSGVCKDSLKK